MGVLETLFLVTVFTSQAAIAQQKCGLVPSKVFLPKGEKRQLVFWTDQDYTQLITSTVSSTLPSSTEEPVDDFLQFVNGGNKPSNSVDESVDNFVNNTDTGMEDSPLIDSLFGQNEPTSDEDKETTTVLSTAVLSDASPEESVPEEDIIFITTPVSEIKDEEGNITITGTVVTTTIEDEDVQTTTNIAVTTEKTVLNDEDIEEEEEVTESSDSKFQEDSMTGSGEIPPALDEDFTLTNEDDEGIEETDAIEATTLTNTDNEGIEETHTIESTTENIDADIVAQTENIEIVAQTEESLTTVYNYVTEEIAETTTNADALEDEIITTSTESIIADDDPESDDTEAAQTTTSVPMTTMKASDMVSSTVSSSTKETIIKTSANKEDIGNTEEEGSSYDDKVVFPNASPTMDYIIEDSLNFIEDNEPIANLDKINFVVENIVPISVDEIEIEVETEASGSSSDIYPVYTDDIKTNEIFDDDIEEYDSYNYDQDTASEYENEIIETEIDAEDKVVVVTSMSIEKDSLKDDAESDSEKVIVVTGSSVPAKTWEELEIIEEGSATLNDIDTSNIDEIIKAATVISSVEEKVSNKVEETTTGMPFLGVQFNDENIELTQEPSFETINISSQDNLSASNDPERIIIKDMYEEETTFHPDIDEKEADSLVIKEASSKVEEVTELPDISSEKETTLKTVSKEEANIVSAVDPVIKVILGISESETTTAAADTTTVSDDLQFDDVDSDDTIITDEPATRRIVDDTTTGAPLLAAVESEQIYVETTTGSLKPSSTTTEALRTSSSYFPIQAIESEYDDDNDALFDETTTGTPLIKPLVEPIPPIIEPVIAEVTFDETTTGTPLKTPSIEPVLAEEDEVTFDETTTGSPLILPLIEPVVADEDELDAEVDYNVDIPEIQAVFVETTTGSPVFKVKNIEDDDSSETTEDSFTPAFTTSPVNNDKSSDSSKIFFPEDIEDMVAKFASKMDSETTEHSLIMDDDTDNDITTEFSSKVEDTTLMVVDVDRKVIKSDSEIVQVEAGNVNGPLALDKVMYVDEDDSNDFNTVDNESSEKEQVDNIVASALVSGDSVEQSTQSAPTTVINGFIINKKVDESLDQNSIETDRTGVITEVNDDMESEIVATTETNILRDVSETDTVTTILSTDVTTEKGESFTELNYADFLPTFEPLFKQNISFYNETDDNENNETLYEVYEDIDNNSTDTIVVTLDDESLNNTESPDNNEEQVIEDESENEISKKPSPFPVTDLLKGIYKLIQGYIPTKSATEPSVDAVQPDRADVESERLEYFDSPENQPITNNVHNAPREPLLFTNVKKDTLEDPVDVFNSNTDPFKQLNAPDLTGLVPEAEREENVQYVFASEVKKSSQPITLSPFNSAALIVKEPPKVLAQDRIDEYDEDEEDDGNSFSSFIQKPFKAFLPSFLTSSNQKQKPKVQVAGSLPVTVREQAGQQNVGRRPIVKTPQKTGSFPFLGSLFNNVEKTPSQKPNPRPLRPDVPAQPSFMDRNGFVPVSGGQRSSPVSIPLPGTVELDEDAFDSSFNDKIGRFTREADSEESFNKEKLVRFIERTPLPFRKAFLKQETQEEELSREKRLAEEPVNCTWTIQTERNLYLLMTFQNLSAPFTVDCVGAYIAIERENNGFEAKWCGNRVSQGGSRPYVIFARNEVRITVFDDGSEGKSLPTGFNGDVEVIDLFDAGEFSSLRKTNGYSNVRQIAGKSLI